MIIVGDRRLENEIRRVLDGTIEEALGTIEEALPPHHPSGIPLGDRQPPVRERPRSDEPVPADEKSEILIMNSAALSRYSSRRANQLRRLKARRKLLVVINEQTIEKIIEAVQMADGVIFRHMNMQHLPTIIALMKAEYVALPQPVLPMLIERDVRREILLSLSPSERHILRLLAHGCSNHVIAATLHVNLSRVKYLIRSLLKKLLLQNRTQAAVFAAREVVFTAPPVSDRDWINSNSSD